jgi:hypothetical protein
VDPPRRGGKPSAVSGWTGDATGEIVVGKRRKRAKRRRTMGRLLFWSLTVALLAVAGAVVAWLYVYDRPDEGATPEIGPSVVAPGGFRATVGDDDTITVGLEVRSVADTPLTLVSARVTAPAGVTPTAVTILSPGPENEGFALDGDLPPAAPVVLGTSGPDRNAVVAARFTVDCDAMPSPDTQPDEQIFVTVEVAGQRREEELTPPVVDDVPWVTATARRLCQDPPPDDGSGDQPLPPLPPNERPSTIGR